ncbi:MAG: S41 family peptidase [Flavobacteriales bacterium]|nr:S41 family peptidase [Flavobacteriales bacterium]
MRTILLTTICYLFSYNLIAQSTAFISSTAATEDINQMVSTFEKVHYNPYFKTSKDEFYSLKKELLDNWSTDSISYKQFMAVGMKLCAVMSGGHSYMYWKNPHMVPEIKEYFYVPFTGKLINDNQTFVVTESKIPSIDSGAVVQSINGIDMKELFLECMSYTGGIEAFKIAYTEASLPLFLFFNDKLKAPYSIQLKGSENPISTQGMDIGELADFINSRQIDQNYTFEILNDEIALISYNSCTNYKKFKKFLKESFKTIAEQNIDKLIIDIRQNGGGDSRLNDDLLSYLTTKPYQQSSGRYWKVSEEAKKTYSSHKAYTKIFGKEFMDQYMNTPNQEVIESLDTADLTYPQKPKNFFEGKSCLLIGPGTFSSANFLADAVKTYKITTIIGAPSGEYTNDFGEQLNFTLPNSGSRVFISSTYDIGANGNATVLEPVFPDIHVEDDALTYAVEWIKK